MILFVDVIDPSRVKVPMAKTDKVTIESKASATMFDLKRSMTYC